MGGTPSGMGAGGGGDRFSPAQAGAKAAAPRQATSITTKDLFDAIVPALDPADSGRRAVPKTPGTRLPQERFPCRRCSHPTAPPTSYPRWVRQHVPGIQQRGLSNPSNRLARNRRPSKDRFVEGQDSPNGDACRIRWPPFGACRSVPRCRVHQGPPRLGAPDAGRPTDDTCRATTTSGVLPRTDQHVRGSVDRGSR